MEADGEASDWMLAKYGILAASPALSIRDSRSSKYFVYNTTVAINTLQYNVKWIWQTVLKLGVQNIVIPSGIEINDENTE